MEKAAEFKTLKTGSSFKPYPLRKTESFSYEFITDQGIAYRVYFMKNDSLFENDPVVGQYIYTCNINVISGETSQSGIDPRIADTVFEIITDFLDEKRKAFVYICDSSDSRELARKRKFDLWFAKYSRDLFAKGEYEMIFKEEKIYSSMIVPLENKIWPNYLVTYYQLTRRIEGSK